MLRLFKGLKLYALQIVLALALIFVFTMTDLNLPNLMSDIVDTGIVQGDVNYILKVGGVMLLVALIGTAASITANYLGTKVALAFGRDLRQKVFEKVESFSLNEFNSVGTASLITRTTNDITQIQQVIMMMLRMMIQAPIMIIGALYMSLNKDVELTKILLWIIPLVLVTIFVIAFFAMPMFEKVQKRIDKLNLVVRENLTGTRVIRVFNKEQFEEKRFDVASFDLTKIAMNANRLMGALMPIMMVILNVSIVIVMWFGAQRIDTGDLQVGNLMAIIQYIGQITFSLMMLSMMFVMIPRAQVSAVRINEVLNMKPVIKDPETSKESDVHGVVEFKNVTFEYVGAEQPALSNISFTAKPGEILAIIGGTGSGKSTIVNMIPRFYDAASGQVLVNGVDVREIKQEELRQKIGYVPQKAVLFTGSIRDNIRYGLETATDAQIEHALEVAQAADFVSKMKEGLDSKISQGGTNVSGGQKQRLSIARAIVRQPEIYIFDDSFSALDFKTDAKLREALKEETKNATMIIVAQRVSTIMDADRILVLDEGHIVGDGKHDELVQNCEIYKEIVDSQLKGEEE